MAKKHEDQPESRKPKTPQVPQNPEIPQTPQKPVRPLKPKDPQIFALVLNMLHRYSENVPNKNDLDKRLEATLGKQAKNRSIAKRIIENYYAKDVTWRVEDFGQLADVRNQNFPLKQVLETVKNNYMNVPRQLASPEYTAQDPVQTGPPNIHTLEYSGVYCQDETPDRHLGYGSDEIYIITSVVEVVNGRNDVRTEKHPLSTSYYRDVDTGEWRNGPLAACWYGEPNKISIICTVMERDEGNPDYYKEEVHQVVMAAAAILGGLKGIIIEELLQSIIVKFFTWILGSADDLIETEYRVITKGEMEQYARRQPQQFIGKKKVFEAPFPGAPQQVKTVDVQTEVLNHFITDHTGAGGRYQVMFTVRSTQGIEPPIVY